MKRAIYVLVIVLLSGVYTSAINAQQKGVDGNVKGTEYNPGIVYQGSYETDLLLFKNSPQDTIWRRIPKLDRILKVTCNDALNHLKIEGKWGGHLKLDGSCG